MATRRKSKAEDSAPMSPDELLALDNQAASKSPGKEYLALKDKRRLYLASREGKLALDDLVRRSSLLRGAWEIELPAGAAEGLPGGSAERLDVDAVARKVKREPHPEPYRPAWLDFTPHPKFVPLARPLLRRIDGRPLEPYYGVFGADDRAVYYPAGYPWSCVGRIEVWNNWPAGGVAWTGSGVLVGPRHVLTAGHVAPWGAGNWAMRFTPAYWDGASAAGAGMVSFVSDYRGYNTNNNVSAWDMAVLRLYTPLGNSLGWFGSKVYNSAWEGGAYWTLAGYPGAIAGGRRPSRQSGIAVIDDDSDGSALEVEHFGDISPGNSGGPFFGYWSGLPYAVGTVSGGSKTTFLWWTLEDNNVNAGGRAMVDLIRWGLANWP